MLHISMIKKSTANVRDTTHPNEETIISVVMSMAPAMALPKDGSAATLLIACDVLRDPKTKNKTKAKTLVTDVDIWPRYHNL